MRRRLRREAETCAGAGGAGSRAVLGLARELRAAEQAALDRFVKDSQRSIGNLYTHILLSVGLAFVLGLAALRLIQIAGIAPLKAELLQSHSILEQKEKLASLGTLAAGVAHEVRNPLTAIKVRLHSLKRALPGNPSARDDLGVINNEINRLEKSSGISWSSPALRRPGCIPSPPRFCSTKWINYWVPS